tara:strand:+ start:180 stop:605 length:426 start_codon:yes stop_codon:yes gene_type:complete
MVRHAILALALGLGAAASPGGAQAEEGRISAELNKLEEMEGGCRAYFLFRNASGRSLSAFEMSLALLDRDGIIDRLLSIEAAPLPAGRTTLKIFEFQGMACADLGEVILHEATACAADDGQPVDCLGLTTPSSRAAAAFID